VSVSTLSWNDYRQWLGATLAGELPRPELKLEAPAVASWSTDTRTLAKGQWYVPITGESFDGHRFIGDALSRGAVGFLYDAKRVDAVAAEHRAVGIPVSDTLAAFQLIMGGWRRTLKDLRLVALTGSSGKTTTKEMLGAILRAAGPTCATPASFNNEVGVPKTLQMLTPEHRFAAVEFGARMPGNIQFLCRMATPDVAGLINVGVAHLGIFGSAEKLLATKLEIFRDSPPHAVLVANADDPRIVGGAKATGKKVLTFGVAADASVRLLGDVWRSDGRQDVSLVVAGEKVELTLDVAHEMFPINAAAAAALAVAAGAPVAAVVKGLSGFSGVKGRYQIHRLASGLALVDDTYNANPDSMRAGLATLARAFPKRRRVVVLADMLELGAAAREEHRAVGMHCADVVRPERLAAVGPEARAIAEGAAARGLAPASIKTFGSADELLASGLDWLNPKGADLADTVLYAKGSNGMKLSRLIDRLLAEGKKP
jgi:UDP-N-acetylmuramoyl-tripeptide--D-alanyl-D-alanine ligase